MKSSKNNRKKGISVKKDENFSEWFSELIKEAELADQRYRIKGFPVYMPWSVKSMKKMYHVMENILERNDHEPLIMPLLIPESNFKLEASHVEGFTPEVFWVTEHGKEEKFEEKYALRPTSETALYQMYSLWIRSYKDLPFKRYQSVSVFRCESKFTRPFLRTREIHWIEAHNVFETEEQARNQVIEDMKMTEELLLKHLAIPFIFFQRPEWDKFAGAVHTYAADELLDNGRVLQLPSTHLIGQNFSKPFNVNFLDDSGNEKLGYITCFGPAISRIYGGMVALHSDDIGLVLPFEFSPIQIIIVPIYSKDKKELVLQNAEKLKIDIENKFSDLIIKIDDDEDKSPGEKFYHWELKGVPIRIEIGPKDIEKEQIVMVKRHNSEKLFVKNNHILDKISEISKNYTLELREKHNLKFEDRIVKCENIDEIKNAINDKKMAVCGLCSIDLDGQNCAQVIETKASAFVRGKRVDKETIKFKKCAICGKPAKETVYIAKSY